MSAHKKPTPVAVLIVPRFFDLDHPTCDGCPFHDCSLGCNIHPGELAVFVPDERCPVHNGPETRAEAF